VHGRASVIVAPGWDAAEFLKPARVQTHVTPCADRQPARPWSRRTPTRQPADRRHQSRAAAAGGPWRRWARRASPQWTLLSPWCPSNPWTRKQA